MIGRDYLTGALASLRSRRPLPRPVLLGAVLLSVALLGGLLTACGGGEAAPVSVTSIAPSSTPSATATPVRTPLTFATASAYEAGISLGTVDELTRTVGDPPDARMARLRIPSIDVNAPVGYRYVGPDGVMPNPNGPADVSWYDFSGWNNYGGGPGGGQNSIFAGHVDYNANLHYAPVHYRGRGVFYDIALLKPGDQIHVDIAGTTISYSVEWIRDVAADSGADWAQLLSASVPEESITLITCGGDFDVNTLEYSHRTVVRAVRVEQPGTTAAATSN